MGRVYILTDPRTGEIRYVGWTIGTIEQRRRKHVRESLGRFSRTYRGRWIGQLLRYGLEPRASLIQEIPISHWSEAERYWISYFKAQGCRLTNISIGGEGPGTVSAETRIRMSRSAARTWVNRKASGWTLSPEGHERMSAAAKGRVISESQREAIRRFHTGRKRPPGTGAAISASKKGRLSPALAASAPKNLAIGRHVRWHVNRNLISTDCALCVAANRKDP